MSKEIIINADTNQQRIAIVEDGRLAELFVESDERSRQVGDIYYGTVAKVMHGIQAAFIDIGLEQDAFLHFSDIGDAFRDFEIEKSAEGPDEDVDEEESQNGKPKGRQQRRRSRVNIQRGQEIIVQVFKEPVGSKGVRVTTEVSLPGRFLVLMPFDKMIGVSRKIGSFKEKRRLRRLVSSILPHGYGVIIRTVAEGKDEEILRNDLQTLLDTWRTIERTVKKSRPPALVHKDMNATSSVIRDLFTEDVVRVAVDSKKMYREIRAYVNLVASNRASAVSLHREKSPIFDTYGVEKQIEQSMSRKVWLKSGGYLIIEHTEAMKVIDVNSGRYAARKEQELNSLRTNLEAAKEVARQIRLRDLGGIIVIDFIDMDHEENRRKVFEEMRREMRTDRAKFTILPLSEFGLMQITRQRVRESVQFSVSETCPTCDGSGLIQSKTSLLTEIERWLKRFRGGSRELRLQLNIHPTMVEFLTSGAVSHLARLMMRFFVRIKIQTNPLLAVDEFQFISRRTNTDITTRFLN